MQRRRFVVGCACGIGAALAGCLGSDEQEPMEESPPENEVDDAIRSAIGEANQVAIELASARDEAADPSEVDVDGDALQGKLESARTSLEEAASMEAAGQFEAELAAAGSYVDVVEGVLTATLDLVAVVDDLESLESALGEGDDDAATEALDAVQLQVQSARDATADAQGWIQTLDQVALSTYGAQTERLADGLAELSDLAVGADHLTTGYDQLLTGREHLETGRSEFENRNFGDAADAFETAGSHFGDASAEFGTGQTGAPEALSAEFDTATCRSGNLEDAADHFAAAASAAADRDASTASSERDDGEAALDAAAAC